VHVGAAAERRAGPFKDDDTDGRVRSEFAECGCQASDELGVEGIARVGPLERNAGAAPLVRYP
jgi:hypothetical protein